MVPTPANAPEYYPIEAHFGEFKDLGPTASDYPSWPHWRPRSARRSNTGPNRLTEGPQSQTTLVGVARGGSGRSPGFTSAASLPL